MRVQDIEMGQWVKFTTCMDNRELLHWDQELMVVGVRVVDRRTLAVVECEDEHFFYVEPRRLALA